MGGVTKTYTYTYDDNGNILTVSEGGKTTSYVYDSQNQLIRENNEAGGFTHEWTYDNAGNILTRKEYAYTNSTLGSVLDTVNYGYGDSDWGDLLKSYDGQAIESDTIGNMTKFGTWSYTWKHGRQLASMSKGSTTWTYTYNADGLRTKRTTGNSTYIYGYTGDKLTYMKRDGTSMYFSYDASGKPTMMLIGNTPYFYVTNLQGDVVALTDSTGAIIAEYTYDAWGNVVTDTSSTVAGIYNPLRYRGYVYDAETGLYYLQSRYYDPVLGRFINADGLVSTGQGLLGYNMFAYCRNNPANKKDFNGYADEDADEEKNQNIENMMQIFGVNSPDDLPELPENCMVFVENIRSFTLFGITIIYGETIVMDNDKYCIYKFAGVGYGVSAIPYDYSITGGYVYNLESVEDYCGFFFGASSNMAVDIKGGAVATNGVYAEIINGVGFGSCSLGISLTYYNTSQTDWIYGKAPMTLIEHPYTSFKQKKPWELGPVTI